MFTGIGLIAFCFVFGSGMTGLWLGFRLPRDQRAEPTQKTVQATMNIVGILSALVLGLLIVGAKTNFDTRNNEIEQFATDLTLLDRELAHYGPETKDVRGTLRDFAARKIELMWPHDRSLGPATGDARTVQMLDDVEEHLMALTPRNDVMRARQANALHLVADLKRSSRLLAVQLRSRTPRIFLGAVIFWLSALFLSYGIFAPRNATVVAAMLVCSLSVSVAVNLIFDMDQPLAGFIRVSPAPMQQALDQMMH